jgi:hypothetical protein
MTNLARHANSLAWTTGGDRSVAHIAVIARGAQGVVHKASHPDLAQTNFSQMQRMTGTGNEVPLPSTP